MIGHPRIILLKMAITRTERRRLKSVAKDVGVSEAEVRKVVNSFFGSIVKYAISLPFNNVRRIYGYDAFEELVEVVNIPGIGRLGPVYSRYLKWRGNEAKMLNQVPRSTFRIRLSQDEIEHIADDILSGKTPSEIKKRKPTELYNRVWLINKNGKRMARQVIPKKQEQDV